MIMAEAYVWKLLSTLVYPALFAIHLTLALLAGLGHFPARMRWQRMAIHLLTGLGFAGIALSSGLRPILEKAVMGPVVRVIWLVLIGVWISVFRINIKLEWARQRKQAPTPDPSFDGRGEKGTE